MENKIREIIEKSELYYTVMKNIVDYELFEAKKKQPTKEETREFFNNLINWQMIEDIKELSLEYLDNGYTLWFDADLFEPAITANIYGLVFDHNTNSGRINPNISIKEFVKYGATSLLQQVPKYSILIGLRRREEDTYPRFNNYKATDELLSTIKTLYPNESIKKRGYNPPLPDVSEKK